VYAAKKGKVTHGLTKKQSSGKLVYFSYNIIESIVTEPSQHMK